MLSEAPEVYPGLLDLESQSSLTFYEGNTGRLGKIARSGYFLLKINPTKKLKACLDINVTNKETCETLLNRSIAAQSLLTTTGKR